MDTIQFTPSQQRAHDDIMAGSNVFVTGHAGTGKSFLLREVISELEAKDKNVVVCAPTGIAAINVGGTTIHRFFGLTPDVYVEMCPEVPSVLKYTDVLIIDEISMCRIDLFDYVGRAVHQVERPIQMIVVGDFCQLPPVIPDAEKAILSSFYKFNVGGGYAFLSPQWERFGFTVVDLKEVVRQDDAEFIEALDRARLGDVSSLRYFADNASPAVLPQGIYLAGRNAEVDAINAKKLSAIKEESYFFKAESKGEVFNEDKRVAPEVLELKVGARVMLTVNDSLGEYFNGSFGNVTRLEDDCVWVQVDDGGECEIEQYTWEIIRYEFNEEAVDEKHMFERNVVGTYKQFPIKLAWATTVHKSQGQTFTAMNLNPDCWDSGQLYVALSRVKSIKGLHFTKPLNPGYLLLDAAVKEFYDCLEGGIPYFYPGKW